MPSIIAAEEMVAKDLARGYALNAEHLEHLIQALLTSLAEHRHRSLDGVLISRELRDGASHSGQGSAITIDDQAGHPIEWRLTASNSLELAVGSCARCGVVDGSPNPYGSPAFNRTLNSVLAALPAQVEWQFQFVRQPSGWVREHVA